MTKVNPTTATRVTESLAMLRTSLYDGYGSGATSTHHRKLVLSWFMHATEDPRETATEFDDEATYTKLGARGIEMALAHYTAFLHDPANAITMTKGLGSDLTDGAAIELPSAADAAARLMIVECVDMMLSYVDEEGYTEIWDIAKASYEKTWSDVDENGVDDAKEAPINLSAPVLSAATRALTVTNGTWTGTPTSYTYVWYLDGVVIAGQTDATYTVPDLDAGDITVMVTATNAFGDSLTKQSNTLTIAAA